MSEWVTKQCDTAPEADEPVGTVHSWPQGGTRIVTKSADYHRECGGDRQYLIPAGTVGIAQDYVEEWHDVAVQFPNVPCDVWVDVDDLEPEDSDA